MIRCFDLKRKHASKLKLLDNFLLCRFRWDAENGKGIHSVDISTILQPNVTSKNKHKHDYGSLLHFFAFFSKCCLFVNLEIKDSNAQPKALDVWEWVVPMATIKAKNLKQNRSTSSKLHPKFQKWCSIQRTFMVPIQTNIWSVKFSLLKIEILSLQHDRQGVKNHWSPFFKDRYKIWYRWNVYRTLVWLFTCLCKTSLSMWVIFRVHRFQEVLKVRSIDWESTASICTISIVMIWRPRSKKRCML